MGKKARLYLQPLGSLHKAKRVKREVLSVVTFLKL